MTKTYLLSYASSLGTRDEIKTWLDEMPQVISWRSELPYSFFITSEAAVAELVSLIHERSRNKVIARFIITDITGPSNLNGWLTADAWKFLNRKYTESD